MGLTPTSSTNTNKDNNIETPYKNSIIYGPYTSKKAAESNVVGIIINYCPICGTKLEINHD